MFCYGSLWECFIFGLVLLVLSGCFGNVVGNVCGDLLVKKGCLNVLICIYLSKFVNICIYLYMTKEDLKKIEPESPIFSRITTPESISDAIGGSAGQKNS